jgi:uncharacterized protein GlcG (DUF336 family)
MTLKVALALSVAILCATLTSAQAPMSYGLSINAENAKKWRRQPSPKHARTSGRWRSRIVDTAGELVYFERMDDTQVGSVDVAIAKARSAARFKRPTKAFQDVVAAGGEGMRILALPGAVPVEGGVPLMVAGKIVGAVGCSGGTSQQDGVCATAGANALK